MSQEVEKLTRETVAKGGVLTVLSFDIRARTSDKVKEIGAGFINSIIGKPGVVYALGEIDEPIANEEGTSFSSYVSVKILTLDFLSLAILCMNHSPFNIEILRPDSIKLEISQAQELLTTFSATTAEYKKYIITKLAKPEEIAQINDELKKRSELAKKILKKEGNDGA